MKNTASIIFCLLLLSSLTLSADLSVAADSGSVVPKENAAKTRFVSELKVLIQKSRESMDVRKDAVDPQLRQRNQQRRDQAREYYLHGQKLLVDGNVREARQLFLKVVAIYEHPEMKHFTGEEGMEAFELLFEMYQTAVAEYKRQSYKEAKEDFQVVEEVCPDYRAVRSYLQLIDIDNTRQQDLAAREQKVSDPEQKKSLEKELHSLYEDAMNLYRSDSLDDAKLKFLEMDRLSPGDRRAAVYLTRIDNDISRKKERVAKQRERDAEIIYRRAVILFDKGENVAAFEKFNEVESLVVDYKDTHKYFVKLKYAMAKKDVTLPAIGGNEDAVLETYKTAVNFYKNKRYADARAKFEEVERAQADYRFTRKYLDAITDILPKPEPVKASAPAVVVPKPDQPARPAPAIEAPKQISVPSVPVQPAVMLPAAVPAEVSPEAALEIIYNEAVSLYKQVKLDDARDKFRAVQALSKNYKSTREYLLLIAKAKGESLVEQDQKQMAEEAKQLAALTARSKQLYAQITALTDNDNYAGEVKPFANIDKVIANLEKEKKRLSRELEAKRREELRLAQRAQALDEANRAAGVNVPIPVEPVKEKATVPAVPVEAVPAEAPKPEPAETATPQVEPIPETPAAKAEWFYRKGTEALQNKNYTAAINSFNEVQKNIAGYKNSVQLIFRAERLEGERNLSEAENKDRARINDLTVRANQVNMAALEMARNKNFNGLQGKLDELDGMLKELQVVKAQIKERRDQFKAEWDKKAADVEQKKDPDKAKQKIDEQVQGRTLRQEAEAFYRDGAQFYDAGQYAEARVKFRDALAVDPSFKPAQSYIKRIDRILERRDFEDRKLKADKAVEKLAAKSVDENESEAAPESPEAQYADKLYEDGQGLFKAKRYKEARIKFEELMKVGNEVQRKQAAEYSIKIKNAMIKAQQQDEDAKRKAGERFLETKRAEAYMGGEKNKALVSQKRAEQLEKARSEEKLAVERQLLLRNIEKDNSAERIKRFKEKSSLDEKAERQTLVERNKMRRLADVQGVTMDGVKQVLAGQGDAAVEIKPMKLEGQKKFQGVSPVDRRLAATEKTSATIKQIPQDSATVSPEEVKRQAEESLLIRNKRDMEKTLKNYDAAEPDSSRNVRLPSPANDKIKLAVNMERLRLEEQRTMIQRDFEAGVERLYLQAVDLYKKRMYDQARASFEQINDLSKGYKKTEYYLRKLSQEHVDAPPVKVLVNPMPVMPSVPKVNRQQAVSQALDMIEAGAVK